MDDNAEAIAPLLVEEGVHRRREDGGSDGGGESGDGASLPHISLIDPRQQQDEDVVVSTTNKIWNDIKKWFRIFRYPFCVLFANFISWIIVVALVTSGATNGGSYYSGGRHNRPPSYEDLMYKTMLKVGLAISMFTWTYDAYICFCGANKFEKEWRDDGLNTDDHRSRPTSTPPSTTVSDTTQKQDDEEQQPIHRFLKLSKRADSTFRCGGATGCTTFVVCLLYGLWTLSLWQAMEAGVGLLQVQFMAPNDISQNGLCFVNSLFNEGFYMDDDEMESPVFAQDPRFSNLPEDVQKWLQQEHLSRRNNIIYAGTNDQDFNQSVPFLQLTDGKLVFSKATHERYGSSPGNYKPGIVVYIPENNSIAEITPSPGTEKENLWMGYDELTLIGFPSGPPYHGWCGIFHAQGRNIIEDEAICHNAKSRRTARFDAVKDRGRDWNSWSSGWYRYFSSDENEVWEISIRNLGRRSNRVLKVTLTSFNIETMQKNVAMEIEIPDEDYSRGNRQKIASARCSTYSWTTTGVSLIALTLMSVYLYRLGVPSCTVPMSSALALLASSFLHPALAGTVLLSLAVLCLFLLVGVGQSSFVWKYVSTAMLIWAVYVLQLAASWVFWSPSFSDFDFFEVEIYFSFLPFPLLSFLVAAATNVVLNHPFLQVLAVCFGSLSIVTLIMVLMGLNFLLVPFALLALALGCFRVGTFLQIYRVHFIVTLRRICFSCSRKIRSVVRQR